LKKGQFLDFSVASPNNADVKWMRERTSEADSR